MKRTLIVAAWLVGMAAIAWSCTAHQVAQRSSAQNGAGLAVAALAPAHQVSGGRG